MIPAAATLTAVQPLIQSSMPPQVAAGHEGVGQAFRVPSTKVDEAAGAARMGSANDPMVAVLDRVGVRATYERFCDLSARAERADRGRRPQEAQGLRTEAMMELHKMQIVAQDYHMKVELASKVVENSTSGARTILQTQM